MIGGMEYQIGEFAVISRLGIKTLRYYHEIGLLLPTRIEPFSGYRYYDGASLSRVRAIQQLKALQFSLSEIAEILDGGLPEGRLKQIVRDKLSEVERELQQTEEIRQRLEAILLQPGLPLLSANTVERRSLPDQTIASIRFRGAFHALNEKIPLLMQTCAAFVCGPPFALYYDDHPNEDDNDIEICVPVSRPVESDTVHSRMLPGGMALTILHEGYYDQISLSYQALVDDLHTQQLTVFYPTREVYLVGGYADREEVTRAYRTEIQFLIGK